VAESLSPLRYPGGKQILARILGHLIRLNGREGGIYVEPYAGGAGAALSLLYGEYVKQVVINDADSRIYAFWHGVVNQTDQFLKLLRNTPLSVEEWKRQRQIYLKPARNSRLRVGFATFYLNRCNRSGIIGNAGVIGGLKQNGKWKIDARFNRKDLARRVERVARYRERITLSNLDASKLLQAELPKPSWVDRAFVYLDPPYYCKGSQLYLNYYTSDNHAAFARYLSTTNFAWVMSYDNVGEIRKLYSSYRQISFNLGYSARSWKIGKELLIVPDHVRFPSAWPKRIPDRFITSADRIPFSMPTEVTSLS
jgi:DNA adenine methylase